MQLRVAQQTDRGRVRHNNEDSLIANPPLVAVADGVGGQNAGEVASALAVDVLEEWIATLERDGGDKLREAASDAHRRIYARAQAETQLHGMATTLTLWMGVWPWYYLLQVGDSRYYLWRDGALTQVTRDQTIAQDLVDQGVFTRTIANRSQFAHVLSSSIGGEQTAPVVTRLRADWRNVHLLCSDGLTKHVSDERIAERLASMTNAQQVCEQLLQDALDDGGSDNITIIVGRALLREG